ncbi:Low-density lipoprotein receptor domain class A [Necator americanus]|uniref:Low-density lipoprotein receptor domain class A n=1 Tax=Necator americanus TaxID=51031 RepID=W2SJE5_NECAM|nr:Low-density lipoprotein receptor domain class A [Necator americanus]ETN69725.1 Low-density lipoprotein receptor domain class A [Necator americanus]
MGVDATFELRVSEDAVKPASVGCPKNERMCRSGHCLPVSQFCDRIVQCPDGDDEQNCTTIKCSSSEFRCESTNSCVPDVVRCDGWKDCHDGSDEASSFHFHAKLRVDITEEDEQEKRPSGIRAFVTINNM